MEDEEYKKLPLEDRCVHKLWKARVNGYEECAKLFRQIDDEKSPEFAKFAPLIKKFIVDSNAMGQEKGLEATLAFVENYANAGKTVSDVMGGVVLKCIAAPKTKTRELALQLTLMYVEIEKHDAVLEELIKGMDQKNPKIVSGCIQACTEALREFGSKIINVKMLVKKISALFADRDKGVRDEAKQLVVEMYRWMGPVLKSQLGGLQPVQITELETEFAKVEGKPQPVRYVRSQQEKQAKMAQEVEEVDGETVEREEDEEPPEIDAYDLADPVDILSKLPKDFYDKLEAKKWQERKEVLEVVENLLKTPKLENGDYGDLVRALKKVIQKDSNVVVVSIAGRCMAALASGLKKRFSSYGPNCVSALFEKFKEKKQSVVTAIRDAIDAVYLTTTIEIILDDILEALSNKNPTVKIETQMFLTRAFAKTLPSAMNKKLLKAITAALTKNINEPDPVVRDTAAEALGTLMKLVGEKAIGPFLVELEKDTIKMTKIRECCEKAVITVKIPAAKKERPATAPTAKAPLKSGEKSTSAPARPARKPAAEKKVISSGSATIVKSKGNKVTKKAPVKVTERELSEEEVDEIVNELFSANTLSELASANWKARLAAAEQILSEIQSKDSKSLPPQALIKLLIRKPGLKDTNFQVLKAKLDIVKYVSDNCPFSQTTIDCCINDINEKFGDVKNGTIASETMTSFAEAAGLGAIASNIMDYALVGQKSPKVMQETLIWLSNAIKEFGFTNLNAKVIIDNSKKALASSNPAVRQAAIQLLGTLYLYMGAQLHVFFENEKPTIREQIQVEFDKYEGEKAPQPTRGNMKAAPSSNSLDDLDDDQEVNEPQVNVQDLMPRVDISSQVSEQLINEINDKNWKTRNEALTKLNGILQEAKFIKSNLGSDLAQALSLRLTDSNVKIAQTALNICEAIAKAMGSPAKQYLRSFLPGFLQALGDNKAYMRTTSLDTMNSYAEQCGYKEFFEGEMICDALKGGSPTLRIELWNWLAERLPKIATKSISKEELLICIPHLYSSLEDRNADVRKNSQEAVLGIMIHVGYEQMVKQTEKLKPGSRTVVMAVLERVRPNMPVKALPKKQSPQVEKEDKAVRGTKAVASSKNAVKPKSGAKVAPVSSRKKDEDIDTSPLFVVNNMKHQRTIDESKLKVLKWNFTQPREEFVELLKDQMHSANVNKTLISNMFHSDFRYHIKAIESLMDDLSSNTAALISNLDLVLKWLTLRFFDTNPSVLLKGLEYLHLVFNSLEDTKYRMLENEASSFIPYLVLKIGDPKDSVRNGVRSLIKQICNVYSVNRLFTYVMEGLKSKNARQRAECLEVMDSIIEDYGITVCTPSPAVCLKEIAKQISDRDNSVRNAALNCIVQAWNIVGEKIYKMVGNISDKEMSLLEERIKRSSRKTIIKAPPKMDVVVPVVSHKELNLANRSREENHDEVMENQDDEEMDEEEDNIPAITLPPQIIQPKPEEPSGPFKLDPQFLQELDSKKNVRSEVNLLEFDLGFLTEDVKVPSLSDARATIMPLSPPKPIELNETLTGININMRTSGMKRTDPVIEKTIYLIGSSDPHLSFQAVIKMQDILMTTKSNSLVDYEDDFMKMIIKQLQSLQNQDLRTDQVSLKSVRALLTLIDAFYNNKLLGMKVSVPVLKDIMYEMITLLVDGKLETCVDGQTYIKVVNVHCVKIIERSDHTNIICALVKLIGECVNFDYSARQTDLSMKCLWRVIKLMPSWGEDEINYDLVLLEVHNFLKKYPSKWWQSKLDTPLRTVKTIIHSSVKIKGGKIMLHLGQIPNTSESEVETYILRLLKSMKIDEVKQLPLKTDAQRRSLSRANHNMLTDIFQKIGEKNETKEGLTLLYDFMQQHPEADIEPFLKKANKFFQDYIKNGLQEIENSRRSSKDSNSTEVKSAGETLGTPPNAGAARANMEYWKERLNFWNKKFEEIQ